MAEVPAISCSARERVCRPVPDSYRQRGESVARPEPRRPDCERKQPISCSEAAVDARKLIAECVGTACLVFFAVGTATLCFGFGVTGSVPAAGVITTALAFGLVLLGLAYSLGPISGAHVNPAVTIGFLVAGRIPLIEAIGYWIAQVVGGIFGALVLWGMFNGAKGYSVSKNGLGADGWGQ